MIISTAIKIIVRAILGMTAEQWTFALNMVVGLAKDTAHASNKDRAAHFFRYFVDWFKVPERRQEAVGVLRFLAVQFARRKGLIPK
jgi:hypothetical protein